MRRWFLLSSALAMSALGACDSGPDASSGTPAPPSSSQDASAEARALPPPLATGPGEVLTGKNDNGARGKAVAFDPVTLAELWSDEYPTFSKFTPPTIARGRLLLPSARTGSSTSILVYASHDPSTKP